MKLNLDRLPDTARFYVDLIGLDAALALILHYGGKTIWPSKTEAAYAEMAENIGEAAADKLVKTFNEPLWIPKCHSAARAVQRDAVRAEFDRLTKEEGLSARKAVAALAVRPPHFYTDRYIWRILSTVEPGRVVDAAQAELF